MIRNIETSKIIQNHDTPTSLLSPSSSSIKSRSNSVDFNPTYYTNSLSPVHRQLNENISRKNLNTVVEAILHVEGGKPLEDIQQHHLKPSSSSAPPKKRKYTTSSLTLEDELQVKQTSPSTMRFEDSIKTTNDYDLNKLVTTNDTTTSSSSSSLLVSSSFS